jgi:hypothetical protein
MAIINTPPKTSIATDSTGNSSAWTTWFSSAFSILNGITMSGSTADRPTSQLWVGRPYFDTDLQTMVYVTSADPIEWGAMVISQDGLNIQIQPALSNGIAGGVFISGGDTTDTINPGGDVQLYGGIGSGGGSFLLSGGSASTGSNGNGGNCDLYTGLGDGTGTNGVFRVFCAPSGGVVAFEASDDGVSPLISFYGMPPVFRPDVTGSRGGNLALENLLIALKNLGLITDSSSP